MRLSKAVLNRFISVEDLSVRSVRTLLDDLGIEVKRVHAADAGDTIYDLELLANRGDHRSYEGIAREIHARTSRDLAAPALNPPLPANNVEFEVQSGLCSRYALASFEIAAGARPLSKQLLDVLEATGERSLHPVIDATNVAQAEIGQPTHAFDTDRINGPIVVREAFKNERCLPLFSTAWVTLPTGALVIADSNAVLAIAGVIGCQGSEVTPATRRILLEAACFDPVAVRRTSRELRISTSASQKFERGSDPEAIVRSIRRVAYILQSNDAANAVGISKLYRNSDTFERDISFSFAQMRSFLAWDLDKASTRGALQRYGYLVREAHDVWSVKVPSWRYWDVAEPADVYEDAIRAMSYGSSPEVAPKVERGALPTEYERRLTILRSHLVAQGFFEVFTDAFYGTDTRAKLLFDDSHPLWAHIETENAVDRRYSLLRNNCVASALEAVSANLRFGERDIRLFEVCRIYQPNAAPGGQPLERNMVWGVVTGEVEDEPWRGSRDFDFWDTKGLLDALGQALRHKLAAADTGPGNVTAGFLHEERRSSLHAGQAVAGVFGEVDKGLAIRFGIERTRVLFFEIDFDLLVSSASRPWQPKLPPSRPPSKRTISFVLPVRVEAGVVGDAIRDVGPNWLQNVRIVDSFALPNPPGSRSVTFELMFDNSQSDKTTKEISSILETISQEVPTQLADMDVHFRR